MEPWVRSDSNSLRASSTEGLSPAPTASIRLLKTLLSSSTSPDSPEIDISEPRTSSSAEPASPSARRIESFAPSTRAGSIPCGMERRTLAVPKQSSNKAASRQGFREACRHRQGSRCARAPALPRAGCPHRRRRCDGTSLVYRDFRTRAPRARWSRYGARRP